jgi:FlaA1/EpsC-like NDP-sugar epimerase
MWRYTSINDLINIIKSSFFGSILGLSLFALTFQFSKFPNSVLFVDFIICTTFLCLSRAAVRFYFSNSLSKTNKEFSLNKKRKNLVIIGAGNSSEKIIREVIDNPSMHYNVVGLYDDDHYKIGATIHGVPILGFIESLSEIAIPFDEVLICIPTATNEQMRRIVAICKSTNKPYRTVPTLNELMDGKLSLNNVREVSMVDLLGRKEIQLDHSSISKYIYGKRVLVTGAGGSIGSELVRNCMTFDPDLLILFDQSEHNLFKIEKECESSTHPIAFQSILGDIRDKSLLHRLFSSFKPDVVFHAAAYKHVPMQEKHPWEAVLTNIQGTLNLIDAAEDYAVDRFVLVSTDKAVNPSNVMGATKHIAEKLIHTKSHDSKVNYMAVRFGNVIGSSGSVIPTFQDQIKNGGPVTITDSNMQRYFMSISEAAQLILQAGALGKGGEIYVLDMGDPVNIKDIAYELIRLSGLEPEKDIAIEYIGSRPGEKMHEELKSQTESMVETIHGKIFMLKNEKNISWTQMLDIANDIIQTSKSYNFNKIFHSLSSHIPSLKSDSLIYESEKVRRNQ